MLVVTRRYILGNTKMGFTIGGDYIPSDKSKKNVGPVKVYKEKRKGAFVTLIKNLPLNLEEKKNLLSKIKKRLACGGSIKEEEILIQGDKMVETKDLLREEGFKVN